MPPPSDSQTSLPATGRGDPFLVIHPLDDIPEEKLGSGDLPRLAMTPSVITSLVILRGYLILMMLFLLFHVLDLVGVIRHGK